jgi:hypothetical protein
MATTRVDSLRIAAHSEIPVNSGDYFIIASDQPVNVHIVILLVSVLRVTTANASAQLA